MKISHTHRSRSLGLFFFAFFFLGSASFAHAAYPIEQIPGGNEVVGDFVVGPTKTDLTLTPGKEQVVELMVTNRMGDRRLFNLSTEDVKGSTDPATTVVLLGDDRGPYSLKDYLKFPEASFELGQGERARIPVTVKVPADAQPGGLYGTVIVTTTSLPAKDDPTIKQAGAKAGSVIVSRIGSLFFITVPGGVEKEGHVKSFSVLPQGKKVFTEEEPIHFQILFENTGSVHLNPYGVVTIRNMLGEEVGSVIADPWFAFPKSLRLRELVWNTKYLFGYYTAEARINRGYDNKEDLMKVSFFVLPWKPVLLVLVVLLVVFFGIRGVVGRFEFKRKTKNV